LETDVSNQQVVRWSLRQVSYVRCLWRCKHRQHGPTSGIPYPPGKSHL